MFLDVRDLTITLKTGEEIAKDISFQVRCFIGGKTCCTVQRNDCRQSTVKKYAILCKTP